MAVKFETDVNPPVWDRSTGELIRPAGAGKTVCVILSDDEGSGPRTRMRSIKRDPDIKVECGPASSCRLSPDVKLEDDGEGVSTTLSPASRQISPSRPGPTYQQGRRATSTPHTPSRPPRPQNPSGGFLPDEPGMGEPPSSSDDSDLDDGSVFKPSKSPSRLGTAVSPTTRSQRVSQLLGEVQISRPHPSPTTMNQRTSVPNPPPLSFYIPIRRADRRSGSKGPSQPAQSAPSPRVHGWKPINKNRPVPRQLSTSFQTGYATPGPSSSAQSLAVSPSVSSRRASKSKSVAQADNIEDDEPLGSANMIQLDVTFEGKGKGKEKEKELSSPRSSNLSREGDDAREKKKIKKPSHSKQHKRHGPSRRARVERTIEETPEQQLPSPELSSAHQHISSSPVSTPPPSPSAMLVSSPIVAVQLATPGPSRLPTGRAMSKTPHGLLTPMVSSSSHQILKRSRAEMEEPGPLVNDPLADDIWQRRFALMKDLWSEERAGRERLEKQMQEQARNTSTLQGQFDGQRARINNTGTRMDEMVRTLDELKHRVDGLDRRGQTNHDRVHLRLLQLEHSDTGANRPAAAPAPSQPRLQPHIATIRPREFYDWGRRGGINPPPRPVIPDTLVRKPPTSASANHARRNFRNSNRHAQSGGQSSSSAGPSRPNPGALDQNMSVL